MKINWEDVVSKTISTFLGTIVIGAALITYNGAMSVDEKVNKAKSRLEVQQKYIQEAVKLIEKNLIEIKTEISSLKGSSPSSPPPSTPSTPSYLPTPLPDNPTVGPDDKEGDEDIASEAPVGSDNPTNVGYYANSDNPRQDFIQSQLPNLNATSE